MSYRPLADRIRPETLDEMVGQEHLVGKNGILRRMLEKGRIGNMIFAGPPGTGKTTIINAIIEIMKSNGLKVNLAAPTGRAAKRMTELTGRNATNALAANTTISVMPTVWYLPPKNIAVVLNSNKL